MRFREHQLDNGLQIIAECNPDAYSTAVGFFVNTGARDEDASVAGVSHFLEHMVFKGSEHRSASDVNRELDELGSHSNAYTSEEHTVYYAAVLPEYQSPIVALLGDMMRPALREDDFEVEKKVILEEIAKYEDQPPFGAVEKCMALFFHDHPLGNNILGSEESVTALTPEQMRAYFHQRYAPSNITLVATGNVDFDLLIRDAERHCGSWPAVVSSRHIPPAIGHRGHQVLQKDRAVQQYVVQLTSGPSSADEDRWAGRLMATILGDDSGSRFFWELIDTGLAEYASLGAFEFQGAGAFITFLCCAPEEAAENLQRIHRMQAEMHRHGVTEEELERAKSKICAHLVLQYERSANRLFSVGNNWLNRRQYRSVREVVDSYQRVTREDIQHVLDKHALTRHATVAVGPLGELK